MYNNPGLTLGGGAIGGGLLTTSDPLSAAGTDVLHLQVGRALHDLATLPLTGFSVLSLLVAAFTLIAAGLALLSLTAPGRRAVLDVLFPRPSGSRRMQGPTRIPLS